MASEKKDVYIIARNSEEMARGQQQLIDVAEARIVAAVEERDDLDRNLELLADAGLDTGAARRGLRRAKKRVIYYSKLKKILEAGFQIVPNMDIDVFAIRTTAKNPKRNQASSRYYGGPAISDQETNSPAAGEGRYVGTGAYTRDRVDKLVDDKGQPYSLVTRWAHEFSQAHFPFALARPPVVEATTRAMALKLFDDMGVLPARAQGDPMVIGRIGYREGGHERQLCFVVAWFLDTAEL